MSENSLPNSLKHGAFSEILILPGENPQDFEKLKNDLFAEYKPSGISEERVIIAVAKAFWQERRLPLYQRVHHARVVQSPSQWRGGRNPLAEYFQQSRSKKGIITSDDVAPPVSNAPAPPTPKSAEEQLLDLGNVLTLEQLEKELEVDSKLQAKIDRLLKRFFQIKAMKQIAGLTASTPAALNGPAPVLELTAQEPA